VNSHGLGVVLAYWITDGLGVREQVSRVIEVASMVDRAISTEETRRVSIILYIGP